MKKGKVCGSDGLSLEFYLHFWDRLSIPLFEMYQEALSQSQFGISTHSGLLPLIPKWGKDPRIIRNLRPLTLLNIDYKLIARTLILRLKKVLPKLISDTQTGFMENRHIQSSLR